MRAFGSTTVNYHPSMRIGVDAGGTFTDFVVLRDDGSLETFKLRSNPSNPAAVIMEGLDRAAGRRRADVVHGSTVATNALLERKGARTAFVTTAGFEDLVHIGRQNRPELYNLTPGPPRPLVPRELCFGVKERAFYDGTIEQSPRPDELRRLVRRLKAERIEAVAICFLHAYRVFDNERAVLAAMGTGRFYLCCSHEISPEFREYERASTTLINAYVGPLMGAYLERLGADAAPHHDHAVEWRLHIGGRGTAACRCARSFRPRGRRGGRCANRSPGGFQEVPWRSIWAAPPPM